MIRRSALILCGAAVCLVVNSCQKLEDVRPFSVPVRGELSVQHAKFGDAIPAEYGDLAGITANPDYPAWVQAWFVAPDKSVVVLWINASSGKIADRVVVIARR